MRLIEVGRPKKPDRSNKNRHLVPIFLEVIHLPKNLQEIVLKAITPVIPKRFMPCLFGPVVA